MAYSIDLLTPTMYHEISKGLLTTNDFNLVTTAGKIIGFIKPTLNYLRFGQQYNTIQLLKSESFLISKLSIATFGISIASIGYLVYKLNQLDSKLDVLSLEIQGLRDILKKVSSHQNI